MRRFFCFLLVLLLCGSLLSPASAAVNEVLEGRLMTFLNNNKLDESNFAMSYYNLTTGESYEFNAQAFLPVGRVNTLPLHLYYCFQEYSGAFLPTKDDPNYNDPDYEYTINGLTLDKCRTESLYNGNETVEKAMRSLVNQYKSVINEKFGNIDEDALPDAYYQQEVYSTEFLMNCLIAMDSSTAIYGDLMQDYSSVQTADAYNSGACGRTIIQIRGQEDGMICAIAKVLAPQPYLIACIISEEAGGDAVLSELNVTICSYIESLNVEDTVQEGQANLNRSDSSYLVTNSNPNDTPVLKWIGYALGAGAGLALVYYLVYLLVRRFRRDD